MLLSNSNNVRLLSKQRGTINTYTHIYTQHRASRRSANNASNDPPCKKVLRGGKSKCTYGSDYLRTNMMADYLDKFSTDINYITYFEDEDCDSSIAYWNTLIVLLILAFMFVDYFNRRNNNNTDI